MLVIINGVILCKLFHMANQLYESVKIRKEIVIKVRNSKKVTGVPIATFFEQLAENKLKRLAGRKLR